MWLRSAQQQMLKLSYYKQVAHNTLVNVNPITFYRLSKSTGKIKSKRKQQNPFFIALASSRRHLGNIGSEEPRHFRDAVARMTSRW